jgi:uncharacterized tellurite resistance protein B-like protein
LEEVAFMSDRDVILKLARVVIAAAWADGQVTTDEINSLKDLLFRLPQVGYEQGIQLNSQDWARLDMYIETPVGPAERARLVADLQDALTRSDQKDLVLRAVRNMVEADGSLSDSERVVLAEIDQAIESTDVGLMGGLQRLLGGAMARREAAVAGAPNREAYFDDFLRNKVYYVVNQRLQADGTAIDIPDQELRRLGLAGGLMAKVAQVDREVSDAEFNTIVGAIKNFWSLSQEQAALVAEVAVSAVDVTYDTFRMMRELTERTSEEERRQFLRALFAVANADGDISIEETEEIRLIAQGINLTHRDFIDAKLKTLGEEWPARAGE